MSAYWKQLLKMIGFGAVGAISSIVAYEYNDTEDKTDLPKHADHQYVTRTLDQIEGVFIHHTACELCTLEEMNEWHMAKGWQGLSYHYSILDGTTYLTNHISTVSYQAKGNNRRSIGIMIRGDFSWRSGGVLKEPSIADQEQLRQTLVSLIKLLPNIQWVRPHSHLGHTECPGEGMERTVGRWYFEDGEVPESLYEPMTEDTQAYEACGFEHLSLMARL